MARKKEAPDLEAAQAHAEKAKQRQRRAARQNTSTPAPHEEAMLEEAECVADVMHTLMPGVHVHVVSAKDAAVAPMEVTLALGVPLKTLDGKKGVGLAASLAASLGVSEEDVQIVGTASAGKAGSSVTVRLLSPPERGELGQNSKGPLCLLA